MLIRPARLDDVPRLISLASQSETAAHWTEAQYRSALENPRPRRVLLVAEDGRNLVGFVVGAEIAGEWELENIVVAAASRRTGLGEALLQALLELAAEAAGSSVFLEVRESNRTARHLYEIVGFARVGTRSGYYRDPAEDAVLYKKILSKPAPEIG